MWKVTKVPRIALAISANRSRKIWEVNCIVTVVKFLHPARDWERILRNFQGQGCDEGREQLAALQQLDCIGGGLGVWEPQGKLCNSDPLSQEHGITRSWRSHIPITCISFHPPKGHIPNVAMVAIELLLASSSLWWGCPSHHFRHSVEPKEYCPMQGVDVAVSQTLMEQQWGNMTITC